jgi:hypothetical protein
MAEQYYKHMSPESSRWLVRCLNEVLLNQFAVQQGLYEYLLVQIPDEKEHKVWKSLLPVMIMMMQRKLEDAKPNTSS